MAMIHELLKRVMDDGLRAELEKEVRRLTGQKKFGLVFEEHLPEATPLHGMKIRVGMTVATRAQDGGALFTVLAIKDGIATCVPYAKRFGRVEHVDDGRGRPPGTAERSETAEGRPQTDAVDFPLDEIVPVAKFGDPIYPVLEPIDKIEHGGGDLWHALIQADNYHALQLLEYLYAGKVDCIYIDPPYNTGARDWKYNNDYVDKDDAYRHSKWLSMMKKRLVIAKRLLNPKDSVLIVTIDEKEYLHLGMLLEELFPEARIQMVSSVINPSGSKRLNSFSRNDEYLYFVMIGSAMPCGIKTEASSTRTEITWETFRRHDLQSRRGTSKGGTAQFYPLFVNETSGRIEAIGDPVTPDVDISTIPGRDGCASVWPIRDNGTEMNWGAVPDTARKLLEKGFLKAGEAKPGTPQKYVIKYLTSGTTEDIVSGVAIVDGYSNDGSVIAHYDHGQDVMAKTNWNEKTHNANAYGSKILREICGTRFNFPKSLYAVHDAIRFFVANKPNALIVDFFAGSGTTLHAVNLQNAEDGGRRRCILVTNNEVSDAEEKDFRKRGLKPGDAEWEAKGIAQYVTWPRTTCSIKGVNVKGEALKGEYITTKGGALGDRALPMADGFKANCEFFKLAFVNKDAVSLGRQFKEILPLLWMRSGAKGARPEVKRGEGDSAMMVLPENGMAILLKESAFAEFVKKVNECDGDEGVAVTVGATHAVSAIEYVYLVTDSEKNYRDMARSFEGKDCVQIYRHYLDNFRINKFATR